ncbi:diguanylate cyclase [Bacillaceae bacterium S4-13-58]
MELPNKLFVSQIQAYIQLGGIVTDAFFLMKVDRAGDLNDFSFRYYYINEQAMNLAQLTKDHIGKTIEYSMPAGDFAFLNEKYILVARNKETVTFSDSVVLSSGLYQTESSLIPIFDDNQEVEYILGITKNITENLMKSKNVRYMDKLYNSFIDHTNDGLVLFNLEQKILKANQAFYDLFGYTKRKVVGKRLDELEPQLKKELEHIFKQLNQGINIKRYEGIWYAANGEPIDISINFTPIPDGFGKIIGVVSIVQDIRELVETKRALQESEERYRLIADNMHDLIQVLNKDGLIVYASPSHKLILGISTEKLVGTNAFDQVHPDDAPIMKRKFKKIFNKNYISNFEYRIHSKNNQWLWVESNLRAVKNNNGDIYQIISSTRDISRRKKVENRLKQMAFTDHLTGLTNRRVFQQKGRKALADAKRKSEMVAIMYLDGDYFKEINDRFGHMIGDEVLILLGERLKQSIRDKDIVARIGGDEFAILIQDVDSNEAVEIVAKRIIQNVIEPYKIEEHTITMTMSIGISIFPTHGVNMNELLNLADQALYEAKNKGKNTLAFYDQVKKQTKQ